MKLRDFEGAWTLARMIEDRAEARIGRLDGRAVFTPSGHGLQYAETGMLRFPGQAPLRAERRYLWREEAGRIAVDFADGRLFHAFDPDLSAPRAQHDCPPDSYEVHYDFTAWPGWTVHWSVTGPRKRYEMFTRYSRPAP